MLGQIDCGLSVGIERMGRGLDLYTSQVPPTRVNNPNPKLQEMSAIQRNMSPDHFDYFSVPIPDAILDMSPIMNMPQTAQNIAEMYQLTRESLDMFTAQSHQKAAAAYQQGFYRDEIIPLEVEKPVIVDKKWLESEVGEKVIFDQDECIRPEATAESMANLNPIRTLISPNSQDIVITPGNACPTNDGISVALLMSEEKALALGLTPQ